MTVGLARWVRRLAVVALAGLVGVLVLASPASAHASLLGTDPVDGALLEQAPAEVTLTFDEPVEVREGAVRLLDADGAEVSAQARSVDTKVVLAVPSDVADGTYIVTWRVISADSHPVAGGFSFSIGTPSSGVVAVSVAEPSTGLRLLRQVGEGIAYLGILAGAGLIVFQLVLLRAPTTVLTRRLRLATRWAVGLAALGLAILVPAVAAYQDGLGLSALFRGRTWSEGITSDTALSTVLVLIGLIVGLVVTDPARRRTPQLTAAGFGATALALGALALVGHTRTFGPSALVLTVDMLHVGAAAIWLGGIIALVLTLSRQSRMAPEAAAGTVAGFSAIAATVVFILATAGIVLGWRILGSWSGLFGTTYGYALLTKFGLALVVVAFAAYNRFTLVPAITGRADADVDNPGAPAWRQLRTTVRVEAGILVAIVAATGVLVTQSPVEGRTPSQPGQTSQQPTTVQAALGSGTATIRLTPATVGVNALEIVLVDAAGQPLVPVANPELTVSLPAMDVGPLERVLSSTGPGRYEAVADFPLAGTWTLKLSVRTTTFDYPVAEYTVEIR